MLTPVYIDTKLVGINTLVKDMEARLNEYQSELVKCGAEIIKLQNLALQVADKDNPIPHEVLVRACLKLETPSYVSFNDCHEAYRHPTSQTSS